MKFFSILIIFCFASLAVFGFFAMDFNAHQQLRACWTATAQGFACADFDPLAIIAFHAGAFHSLSLATIIALSVLLIGLMFVFCFATTFAFPFAWAALRLLPAPPTALVFVQRAVALREHSPTAF